MLATRHVLTGTEEELLTTRHVLRGTEEELLTTRHVLTGTEEELLTTRHVLTGAEEELLTSRHVLTGTEEELLTSLVDLPAPVVLAFTPVETMGTNEYDPRTAALLGTDRLGRPFTDAERDAFARQLRDGGFHEARAYGKLFAWRLARGEAGAEDLVQRACLRLVRWGWDPAEVPLRTRLVRLVWSEWTHEKRERKTMRGAEERFLREQQATAPAIHVRKNPGGFATVNVAQSTEDQAARIQQELDEDRAAEVQLEKLRARFERAGDTVNLLWLGYTREGISDLQEMATRSARDVADFYDAARRRKRHVARLAAESHGVTYDEEESPS